MKRLSNIYESVWNDMRKRSLGSEVKMENSVDLLNRDDFHKKLNEIYSTSNTFSMINNYENFDCIVVPLLANGSVLANKNMYICIEGFKDDKRAVTISLKSIERFPKIYKLLQENYKIDEYPPTDDRGAYIEICPITGKTTNSFFLSVIDFIMQNGGKAGYDVLISYKNDLVSESVWNDMRKRSLGDAAKMEDDVNTMDTDNFCKYLKNIFDCPNKKLGDISRSTLSDNISIPLCKSKIEWGEIYSLSISEFETDKNVYLINSLPMDEDDPIYKILENEYSLTLLNYGIKKYVENDNNSILIQDKNGYGITSRFILNLIDYLLNNLGDQYTPLIIEKVTESVWNDMRKRSLGQASKAEDDIDTFPADIFCEYLKKTYVVNPGVVEDITAENGMYISIPIEGYKKDPDMLRAFHNRTDGITSILIEDWEQFEKNDLGKLSDLLGDGYSITHEEDKFYGEILKNSDEYIGNKEFIDIIDKILSVVRRPLIKKNSGVTESVWNDMRKRSLGEEIKKEDELTEEDKNQLAQYISDYGREVVLSWGRGGDACNLDEFIDYLEKDRKIDSRIINYVKVNWFDEICDEVAGTIENVQEEYGVDESVWNDMRKRSLGSETKAEDDINLFDRDRFAEYLSDLYSTTHFNFENESNKNKLCMPILEPKHNNPEGWAFNLTLQYDNPLAILLSDDFGDYYPELYKKLQEAFTVKIEQRKFVFIVIYPQNGERVTNQFYIDVLNFIIDNVENKEELIIRRK